MRLIDADDLTKYIEEIHCENCDNWNEVKCKACEIGGGLDYIYGAPTVEERKHGHWNKVSPAGIYECSNCGDDVMTTDIECYKYCHRCGAKMDEVSEDE